MSKFIFFLITFPGIVYSQKFLKKTEISSSTGFFISSDKVNPFLIRSNQYGLVPLKAGTLFLSGTIKKDYDSLFTINRKLKFTGLGYGFTPHVNLGAVNQLLIPEAYIKARFKAFEVYIGRRKEIQGIVDTVGTMGSYIWSGNALPLPKVEISVPNYTPILRSGLISIKGNFAHGWFGDGDSVKNYWLHQKSVYIKIGKPVWKIKLYGGFNHQVQWGGRPSKPFYDEISKQTISNFGSDIATFIQVATGLRVSKLGEWDSQNGVAGNEAGNRSGNHLGSLDIAMEYNFNKTKILIYRQSIYDDGSLFYLNNIVDGLNGISITKSDGWIRKICFEYLNTTNQGGKVFFDQRPELRGQDNYFNNGLYKDGWAYKGNTIGNPFMFVNSSNILNEVPYNSVIVNNRVKSFSLYTENTFKRFYLTNRMVNNYNFWNYGVNLKVLREWQTYSLLKYKRGKFDYNFILASQFNNKKSNLGFSFSVRRNWR